ncbi:antibiotic biosynthesis monooxygenase [Streptomyces sp. NPDC004609]|uniref:antibiotic biosynthesis monooxygenase n=1 Tax=Streptomyces sp. NPDC004609 TaxID=3364704 RepID=UPI00369EF195
MPVNVAVRPGARPDLDRPGVGVVKVSTWDVGTPERQRATLDAIAGSWRSRLWPIVGLLSYTVHAGEDGRTLLHYSQWASEDAYQEFSRSHRDERNAEIDAAVPGIVRLGLDSYRLYRSGADPDDDRVPGCVVIVDVRFDGPDAGSRRDWVDSVFAALGSGDGGHSEGISAYFHISTDGTRVLDYAEWVSADGHRESLARAGGGGEAVGDEWRKVQSYPGMTGSRVDRYTPGLSLRPGV